MRGRHGGLRLWIALFAGHLPAAALPAYFLAVTVFRRTGGTPTLAMQFAAAAVGFVLYFSACLAFLAVQRRRHGRPGGHRHFHAFRELTDALDRIAAGDFDVSLDAAGGRNELAEKVNRMAQRLSSMEHMRQDFVSNVSHEIQSPLTSIRGFAELLKNDGAPAEERRRYAAVIEAEVSRLSRLSDNLLRLALLDSSPATLAAKPYRLDRQIADALLLLEPQWSAKRIEVEADLAPTTAVADEELLGQVWINLLHNAIKFTPDGGAIHTALSRDGEDILCTVADTGIGIAEEDRPHLFERFYKADRARPSDAGGSGLGLALAKQIVHAHGGSIQVTSEPGLGSAFTVRIPATPVQYRPDERRSGEEGAP